MTAPTDLRGLRLRITLDMTSDASLGDFPGTVIRGALAAHLRKMVCVTSAPSCAGCIYQSACAYHRIFEAQARPGQIEQTGFEDAPKPFILHYPTPLNTRPEAGRPFQFDAILLGPGTDFVPHLVHALRRMETAGLGYGFRDGQGRFTLRQVDRVGQGAPATLYHCRDQAVGAIPAAEPIEHLADDGAAAETNGATVHLLTPLRLTRRGRWLNAGDLEFDHLAEALLRRIDILERFYGAARTDRPPVLPDSARDIRIVRRRMHWRAQERYSYRQKQTMPMDGLVGSFDIEGDLAPIWPLLRAGTVLHAGKGATMGMGQIGLAIRE